MTDFEKRIYGLLCKPVQNKPVERTEEEIFDILHNGAESKELYHNALIDLCYQKLVFQILVREANGIELPKLNDNHGKPKFIADIHVKEYESNKEKYTFIDPLR